MRLTSSRLILLLTLLSGLVLDLTALDVMNHPPPYIEPGCAPDPALVPPSRPSSPTPDHPSRPVAEAVSKDAVDRPAPSELLFMLILAAVTAAATRDVISGELERRRTARPEWLALNLFVRDRLDGWEELHWSEVTGTGERGA